MKADKLREVKDGHDGTWVAHPALVTIALDIFNQHMKEANQISKQRPDVRASEQALLAVSPLDVNLRQSELNHVLNTMQQRIVMDMQLQMAWLPQDTGHLCAP